MYIIVVDTLIWWLTELVKLHVQFLGSEMRINASSYISNVSNYSQ